MDCGLDESLTQWLSFIGLGKVEAGTPSTVALDHDGGSPDAAMMAASKKLSFDSCLSPQFTPASAANDNRNTEVHHSRCNPQACRMTSGMCVDCGLCRDHCICDGNNCSITNIENNGSKIISAEASSHIPPHRLSVRNKQALITNVNNMGRHRGNSPVKPNTQRQQYPPETLRKTLSLMSSNSSGSEFQNTANKTKMMTKPKSPESKAKAGSPKSRSRSRSKSKNPKSGHDKNPLRFDMGDDGQYLHLTHEMLETHTYRSSDNESSHHSFYTNSSSNTGSSRRRYNFDDDNDNGNLDFNKRTSGRNRRRHRRTTSGQSNSSSRKSSRSTTEKSSFSLLSRKKKSQDGAEKNQDGAEKNQDQWIGVQLSFSFDNSVDRTPDSASTKRMVNSGGGSSLSSSSRSYLVDGSIASEEPKKSWFRLRSKE